MIAVLSGRSEAPAVLPTALLAVAETQGCGVPFIDDDGSLVMMYDNAPRADGSGEIDSAAERNRRRLKPILERLSSPDAIADPDMVWLCHNVTAQVAMRAPLLIDAFFQSDMIRDLFKVHPGEEFPYRLFADRPHLLANYCACASGENEWWKGHLKAGPDRQEVLSLIGQIYQLE
nr:hypothetical protein [Methylorubrum zatmanii]